MDNISKTFSIKDLENLSGIKAHTIRIWEKRYGVLEPERTDTNIRSYNLENLQKLLNVTLLYNNNYKISKISQLSEDELKESVRLLIGKGGTKEPFLDALKISMLNFDIAKFDSTYNRLLAEFSFREVFTEVFIPLLDFIGLQWQSDNISPAHEHFICNLILQKLHISIERVQQIPPVNAKKAYVLYLPSNEIHELGLLYLHYELSLKGFNTIYLGESVPMETLSDLHHLYEEVHYFSLFTVRPYEEDVEAYLNDISEQILVPNNSVLWLSGRRVLSFPKEKTPKNVILFNSIKEIVNKL